MTVAGDPASLSQAGATLRRLSERLRRSTRQLHEAVSLDDPRGGAAVAHARRQASRLDTVVATASAELDRIGSELQAHASDLAQAVGDARLVADRATATGLRRHGDEIGPDWGVQGVADPATASDLARRQDELQARLDSVATMLDRRRQRLLRSLAQSRAALAHEAEALRR